MKRISIGLFATFLVLMVFTACQESIYMDWKMANERWYNVHKSDPGIKTTSTGLCYKYIFKGDSLGKQPKPVWTLSPYGSWVTVNYVGNTVDGIIFDSGTYDYWSYKAIKGWQEVLPKLHVGDSIVMYVPSVLAYDTATSNSQIPPNSVLIFHIRLKDTLN